MALINSLMSKGTEFAHDLAKYVKACGKRSVVETKPIFSFNINPQELRYEVAFGKPLLIEDKTLNANFIKELMNVKGTLLEKTTQIKDKMLDVMGYDSSIVKVTQDADFGSASFDFVTGIFNVSEKLNDVPNLDLVCAVRHELDHFEKLVGMIKTAGIERTKTAVRKMTNADIIFNDEFYRDIVKKCKMPKIFDSKRYLDATSNYKMMDDFVLGGSQYFGNALEDSAYRVQKQLGRVVKHNYCTSRDLYPKSQELKNLMSHFGYNINSQEDYVLLCDWVNLTKSKNENLLQKLDEVSDMHIYTLKDDIAKELKDYPIDNLEKEMIDLLKTFGDYKPREFLNVLKEIRKENLL